jgi:glycine reductase
MRLELGNFPVKDVVFGSETAWKGGVLELDHDRLLAPVLAEPNVREAKLEVTRPGDSARIINHYDIMEPRVKVSGPGTAYPGRAGRSVDTVGQGRTHRLGGLTLVVSYDGAYDRWGSNAPAGYLSSPTAPKWFETHDKVELPRADRRQVWSNHHFIDMSGPGAVLPLASTINVCLSLGLTDGLDIQNKASVSHSIGLKLQDTIAETVRDLEPPEMEAFDMGIEDPSLPGMVFVWLLSSPESRHGPQSMFGTGVYGHTRLSAPWLLWPTEIMDGAITGGGRGHGSWAMTNNPIVMGLSRRHGKSLNFLSCIILRVPWHSEEEMQFIGNRAAEAAKQLGAKGAIVTNEVRGLQFVSSARTVQAIERAGVKTVWMSEEEDNEGGTVPPFLYHPAEMEAVVSTGTGAAGPFPEVERVLGSARDAIPEWYGEQPSVPGRYGVEHVLDHYGFGKQYCLDY